MEPVASRRIPLATASNYRDRSDDNQTAGGSRLNYYNSNPGSSSLNQILNDSRNDSAGRNLNEDDNHIKGRFQI